MSGYMATPGMRWTWLHAVLIAYVGGVEVRV